MFETKRMKDYKTKNSPDGRVTLFTKPCKEGQTFVCVIRNGCLYHKSVKRFDQGKYSVDIKELVTPAIKIILFVYHVIEIFKNKKHLL